VAINAPLAEQIESLVDQYSVKELLEALADVCCEKAEHLEANWQDGESAKPWRRTATRVEAARIRAEV